MFQRSLSLQRQLLWMVWVLQKWRSQHRDWTSHDLQLSQKPKGHLASLLPFSFSCLYPEISVWGLSRRQPGFWSSRSPAVGWSQGPSMKDMVAQCNLTHRTPHIRSMPSSCCWLFRQCSHFHCKQCIWLSVLLVFLLCHRRFGIPRFGQSLPPLCSLMPILWSLSL